LAAFADKAALRSGIKTWLSESSIADTTVDIAIGLAEARINRKLRLLDGEATTSLTISSGTVTVPTGFRGVVGAYLSTSPISPLEEISPDRLNDKLRAEPLGKPRFYAIKGNGDLLPVFKFAPAPDTTYTMPLAYTRTWALVEDDDTNKILDDHPDCYLYGALVHGRLKLQAPERIPDMKLLFDEALDELAKDDRRTRRGRGREHRTSVYQTSRGWH